MVALGHGGSIKLCLCCHVVVLGHSVGRYRCFCVIRRQYWILKAFKQVSSPHHRAALQDGSKVSMCGSDATWPLQIGRSVTRPAPDTVCLHWDTAGVHAAGTDRFLMLPAGFARTWRMQELASLNSHVIALGHKHVNKCVHSTTR